MADSIKGVVTAVARTGKSIQLDDGNWYSAFNASQLSGIEKGDNVEVQFKMNGRYRNVQGNVTKSASTGSSSSAPAAGGRSSGGRAYRANGEEGGFPIHPLAYERALDRRNAIASASAIIASQIAHGTEFEDVQAEVIGMAMAFESYTTGDLDRAAMAEMSHTDA